MSQTVISSNDIFIDYSCCAPRIQASGRKLAAVLESIDQHITILDNKVAGRCLTTELDGLKTEIENIKKEIEQLREFLVDKTLTNQ